MSSENKVPGRGDSLLGSEHFPLMPGFLELGGPVGEPGTPTRGPEAPTMRESFTLGGEEGLPIYGEVWMGAGGRNLPAVVLCHGFQGFKDWAFFPYVAESFVVAGFAVVTFSASRSGVGPGATGFDHPELVEGETVTSDLADLGTVLSALFDGSLPAGRVIDLTKVALLGHSRGGALALLMARRNPRIAALVTWSAPARFLRADAKAVERWRREGQLTVPSWSGQPLRVGTAFLDDLDRNKYDLCEAAAALPVPYLIVHGRADETVPPAEAEELYEASPSEGVEMLWLPEADHNLGATQPFAGPSAALEEAISASREFFTDTMF
jgi:uncharacterized protein